MSYYYNFIIKKGLIEVSESDKLIGQFIYIIKVTDHFFLGVKELFSKNYLELFIGKYIIPLAFDLYDPNLKIILKSKKTANLIKIFFSYNNNRLFIIHKEGSKICTIRYSHALLKVKFKYKYILTNRSKFSWLINRLIPTDSIFTYNFFNHIIVSKYNGKRIRTINENINLIGIDLPAYLIKPGLMNFTLILKKNKLIINKHLSIIKRTNIVRVELKDDLLPHHIVLGQGELQLFGKKLEGKITVDNDTIRVKIDRKKYINKLVIPSDTVIIFDKAMKILAIYNRHLPMVNTTRMMFAIVKKNYNDLKEKLILNKRVKFIVQYKRNKLIAKNILVKTSCAMSRDYYFPLFDEPKLIVKIFPRNTVSKKRYLELHCDYCEISGNDLILYNSCLIKNESFTYSKIIKYICKRDSVCINNIDLNSKTKTVFIKV